VTHSMGGLVGRALLHPEMGNIESKILGVVHIRALHSTLFRIAKIAAQMRWEGT
jgi:hypothetical protein